MNDKKELHNWCTYSTQTYWRVLCVKHHVGAGAAKAIRHGPFYPTEYEPGKKNNIIIIIIVVIIVIIRQLQDTGQYFLDTLWNPMYIFVGIKSIFGGIPKLLGWIKSDLLTKNNKHRKFEDLTIFLQQLMNWVAIHLAGRKYLLRAIWSGRLF